MRAIARSRAPVARRRIIRSERDLVIVRSLCVSASIPQLVGLYTEWLSLLVESPTSWGMDADTQRVGGWTQTRNERTITSCLPDPPHSHDIFKTTYWSRCANRWSTRGAHGEKTQRLARASFPTRGDGPCAFLVVDGIGKAPTQYPFRDSCKGSVHPGSGNVGTRWCSGRPSGQRSLFAKGSPGGAGGILYDLLRGRGYAA